MATTIQNYVYGAGKLFFDPFLPGTTTPTGLRYFGNTTKYAVSQKVETADSRTSYGGVISKSDAKVIQVDVGGKFTTDNINNFNVSQFFAGIGTENEPAPPIANFVIASAAEGIYYQIGATDANPFGYQKLTNVTVTAAGVTAPLIGVDYELDLESGMFGIPIDSRLIGKAVTIVAFIGSYFKSTMVAAQYSVAGILKFVPKINVGSGIYTYIPYAAIRPSEDYDFKSNSFQEMTFEFDALMAKPATAVFNTTIAGL